MLPIGMQLGLFTIEFAELFDRVFAGPFAVLDIILPIRMGADAEGVAQLVQRDAAADRATPIDPAVEVCIRSGCAGAVVGGDLFFEITVLVEEGNGASPVSCMHVQ